MEYSPYVISLVKESHTFLFNTKNNISLKIENQLLDKVKVDYKTRQKFNSFLASKKFFPEESELDSMVELFRERDDSTLRIIILAHGDCNFRCKYCYEKFINRTITSQKSGILAFVKKKLSEHHFKDLHVSWFGGEPLLGYKDILDISRELIAIAEQVGICYHSDITTNGYLLSRTVLTRLITECYVQYYQVTVDGAKEGHDNQRVLKNGYGSYERIIKNLNDARALDLNFKVLIRLNVSKENYKHIDKFLIEDAQLFKGDKRFQLLFRNVGDWRCGDRTAEYKVTLFDEDVSFILSKRAIYLGFSLYDEFMFRSNYYSCYAQKPHSYTIDTKGNLLKCTVALYEKENNIGELGNPQLNEQHHKLWVNSYRFPPKCLNCQLLLICKGGACPKRDIFNEHTFEEACYKMKQNILKYFELSILSNTLDYELRSD
ncbi:TPA: radical SAM protein [Streptococcus equi subsp. zooepidemicus]|uniref:Radical SAM core domain-containing protein n=2 Tax=Streptococcus equi TaxID=1336 RepID=A0A922NT80_9STRE|nr:radical SAM protein [Streptococcus equi]HEL0246542.1 radical SAM protein [Streptococcus equi subsp. zooepidemicus]HEL1012434.1 radical SAM protein [Streptococcus equi subsp. ruminatorum]KED03739.1 hypothetical protein CECT5772_09147 [Streptococcus equi subsp. ruminatorum CECT 5772]SUN47449.1 transcriptional regulator [Streptococcus equi subsp. equi]HEL1024242.1 radical SAM protein [Streptococcus equi subsp. ruminatorum CECT 5772]